MKQKLNNPKKQVSDFFSMESGKIATPKNPYNIVWLIDNASKEELIDTEDNICSSYKKHALDCINNDIKFEIEDEKFMRIIASDRNISTRLENLVTEHGATLKNLGLAITKTNKILSFKKAIELGLDINYSINGNNVLRNSLKLKKREMSEILWNHPNIDKTFLDYEKRNYAYHALEKINIDLVNQIFNENPELFLMRDKTGQTIFHAIRMYQNNIKSKETEIVNLLIKIQKYTEPYGITLETPNNTGLIPTNINKFLKEIQDEYTYRQLDNKLPIKKLSNTKKKKL